jgi:hypothetical protein
MLYDRRTRLEYFLQHAYLFKGEQLCIPKGLMCEILIRELHSNGLARHFKQNKTINLQNERYH